ncbi:retrovirus-related pol polyprotein from transposon TNT 1-94, partial [Tanacetum coccineum]
CYADASFQTDKDDTKSQTGYVFVLNGGVMDWKSATQSTTAMSSIEVEYIAAAKASMEVVWMRKFIDGLGDVMPSNKRPMEMLCDNEPALAISSDHRILKGAIHFYRKYHYIRKVIRESEIVLKKVHTDDNVADPFTKLMPLSKRFECAMAIGIVPSSYLDNDFQQVDDIIFGSTTHRYTQLFADLMKCRFEMSMMGEMKFFLGLQVNKSPRGIFINQSNYVLDILKKYGMETCDPIGTPMEIKDKLELDQNGTLVDARKYRSMIGILMYLTSSRTDIVHVTCLCARYQAKPTEKHLKEDVETPSRVLPVELNS